jgi:hypothetical protein
MGSKATSIWVRVGWLAIGLAFLVVASWTACETFHGRHSVPRARVKADIDNLMMALTEYHNQFAAYPPGGTDLNDDGDLDDPGEGLGCGRAPADPAKPRAAELQLRWLTVNIPIENNTRTVGPYYNPRLKDIDKAGRFVDIWGRALRYLPDGRRTTIDPGTGFRLPGRVTQPGPVIWSVGEDGRQDPGNNNRDDDGDGKVDDPKELVDDICSWN